MDLTQVETFVEVARLGSVTRATESLVVSQPTVTRRLSALESELGVQLFVRTSTGVRLTAAGRAYLPYAERVIAAAADGNREVSDLRRRAGGTLVVGTTHGFSTTVLPLALSRLRSAHPSLRLVLKTRVPDAILDLVLRGEVALGIVQHVEHPELQTIDLYEAPLVVATLPSDPLARAGHVRLRDLDAAPVIFEASTRDDASRSYLRADGIESREAVHIDTVEGAKRMVEEGLGVAILPLASIAAEVDAGRLVALAIDDPVPPQRVAAIRRVDEGRIPESVRALIAIVREIGAARAGRVTQGRRSRRER